MISLPKPEVIITHESDLDGLIAGVLMQRLAKALFGDTVRLDACHYHVWRTRELRERSGWVADFSFESRLDKSNWVLIDHHTSTVVPKNAVLVHDINKSAGTLCYELCKEQGLGSPELDRLVHLNNVSDLFLENDPDFVLAGDYANLVKVYGFWNIHALIDGCIERLLDHPLLEVIAVKRRVEDPIGLAWSQDRVAAISSSMGYVDTVVGNNNLVVYHMLEKKLTPYQVLVTLFRKNNGMIVASFRSQNGEALKAAEKLQGGGHGNAAGAILPRSVRNTNDALDYLKMTFAPPSHKARPLNSLESLMDGLDLKN